MLISIGDAIRPGQYGLHSAFWRVANYIAEAGPTSAPCGCRVQTASGGSHAPCAGDINPVKHPACECCGGHHAGFLSLADETVGAGPFTVILRRESHAGPAPWPLQVDIDDRVIRLHDEPVDRSGVTIFDSTIPSGLVRPGPIRPMGPIRRIRPIGPGPIGPMGPIRPIRPIRPGPDKSYRSYRTDPDFLTFDSFQHALQTLKNHVSRHAPAKSMSFLLEPARRKHFQTAFEQALCGRMIQALNLWHGGSHIDAVSLMKGCGFGLTPGGDDVIAGIMTGLHVACRMLSSDWKHLIAGIRDHSFGDNPISNAGLCAAAAGRVNEVQKELLQALGEHRMDGIVHTADRIMATGETSGADWLTGLIIGFATPGKGCDSLSEQDSFMV